MAKSRRREELSVTLFPFLSILACVIGVLTLLITAVALGQMNTKSEDEKIRRAEDYLAIRNRLPADRKKAEELRKLIEKAEALRRALEAALAERDKLKKLVGKDGTEHKTLIVKLLAEARELQERIKSLESQIDERRKLMKPLEAELAKRREPRESEVIIKPGGTGVAAKMTPTFVEANATGIVIYEGDKLHRIARGSVASDPNFARVCKQVAANEEAVVIFLIRSDGYSTYSLANRLARSRGARTGKLPVIGQGHINLKLFEKKS